MGTCILKFNLFVCVGVPHVCSSRGVHPVFETRSRISLELTNFARLSRHQTLEILQSPPSQVFVWVLDIRLGSSCTQVDTIFSRQHLCNHCAFIRGT